MCPKVGSGLNRGKEFKVIHDEEGLPSLVIDSVPFYVDMFVDEAGYEVLERYYLVLDFKNGGLAAEVTQTWLDVETSHELSCGHYSLDQLDERVRGALIRSRRLQEMSTKILQRFIRMVDVLSSLQVAQEAERDG
jgi:hypothetical protein